jgi:hypothetical protein
MQMVKIRFPERSDRVKSLNVSLPPSHPTGVNFTIFPSTTWDTMVGIGAVTGKGMSQDGPASLGLAETRAFEMGPWVWCAWIHHRLSSGLSRSSTAVPNDDPWQSQRHRDRKTRIR